MLKLFFLNLKKKCEIASACRSFVSQSEFRKYQGGRRKLVVYYNVQSQLPNNVVTKENDNFQTLAYRS